MYVCFLYGEIESQTEMLKFYLLIIEESFKFGSNTNESGIFWLFVVLVVCRL